MLKIKVYLFCLAYYKTSVLTLRHQHFHDSFKNFIGSFFELMLNIWQKPWHHVLKCKYRSWLDRATSPLPNSIVPGCENCILSTTWHLDLSVFYNGKDLCAKLHSEQNKSWTFHCSCQVTFTFTPLNAPSLTVVYTSWPSGAMPSRPGEGPKGHEFKSCQIHVLQLYHNTTKQWQNNFAYFHNLLICSYLYG